MVGLIIAGAVLQLIANAVGIWLQSRHLTKRLRREVQLILDRDLRYSVDRAVSHAMSNNHYDLYSRLNKVLERLGRV